ncbi:MAG TPA: twin-arginine translocation signal domain-containing protein, partial [Actinomycetota bacterium]|nr:twin-arginine translocation signal domain-containing protein [Actinomycetota bacterium]
MGGVDRRRFLQRLGVAGAVGGAAVVGAKDLVVAQSDDEHGMHIHDGMKALHGTVGRVDHVRNGFHPLEILTDFDRGEVSRDANGRVVREYEFLAVNKEIEVAPGVF